MDPEALTDYDAARTLGVRVTHAAGGHAVVDVPANAAFENPFAWQGGFIAAVADAAAVAALGSRVPDIRTFTTVTLNATYLQPVPKGEGVTAAARVVRLGRRVAVVDVDVRPASGAESEVAARFTMTFLVASAAGNASH